MADRAFRFKSERNPILIVDLEGEQVLEAAPHIPVEQFGAVEKHDAGGDIILAAIVSGSRSGQDGLAFHVARQKLADITHREDIWIDNNGVTPIVHQLWRHEAAKCEGLKILVSPDAPA